MRRPIAESIRFDAFLLSRPETVLRRIWRQAEPETEEEA